MNAKGDFSSRSWEAPINLKPAPPIIITKTGLVAFLAAGISFTALAQSFYNLDFEQASLIPVPGGYTGVVQIAPALPGWSVFTQAPFVLYDNMFLDSAGVSIFDPLMGTKAFHGNFTVILEGGFSLYSGPSDRLPSAIAQTGLIPAWANTLLFDAWMMDPADFTVSLGPFYVLDSYTNYNLYAVDVSGLSGQTVGLAFTALPRPPPGLAINTVYLDDIRFSSSRLAAPPFILTPPRSQTVHPGSSVEFTVFATGFPPPAFQWFFNGTNSIPDARNSILELTNVQFSQSGAYTVVFSNVYSVVTSPPAILTVQDPFITNQPASLSTDAKQTACLSVGAGGTKPLSFQWLKNGAGLTDGGSLFGTKTSTLTLSNVLGRDAAAYSVIVSNNYSSVTSQLATLTVHDPLIVAQPVSQTVDRGRDARCRAPPSQIPACSWPAPGSS